MTTIATPRVINGRQMKRVRHRGANPTPRHIMAAAEPHRVRQGAETPSQLITIPPQISMWGNGPDPLWPVAGGSGDCVSAEEALAKAVASVMAGLPEVFITDATLYAFCKKNGFLNGADLNQVMQTMQKNGFQQDGLTYCDGPPSSVDWTNTNTLFNAISLGPVKLGVAADQLETAVDDGNDESGWFGTGFKTESASAEDHCICALGFGPCNWLGQQLGKTIASTAMGVAVGTWDSIGVLDWPSFLALTFEAWLRSPTTVILGTPPVPTPVPTPTPTPAPPKTLTHTVSVYSDGSITTT
jgi:hypothetical protein